jgi:hypothetical protein
MPTPPATIPGSELPVRTHRAGADGAVLPSILSAGPSTGRHALAATTTRHTDSSSAAPRRPAPPATIPGSELPIRTRRAGADGVVVPSILSAGPATGRCELATTTTRQTDPSSAAPGRPAAAGNTGSEAAGASADAKGALPAEPGRLGIGTQMPFVPSAAMVPGAPPPAATGPDPVAPWGHGPYPQCRYLGCCGPIAWRGCVYCEEIQHYDYYPALHGNYYFAPYNAIKVPFQQVFAAKYGGDPRDPYADGVFQKVYAAYRAAHPASASGSSATNRPEEVPSPTPTVPSGGVE